jgi:RNA polymerase sigma-70 factor (ECF subfamily)
MMNPETENSDLKLARACAEGCHKAQEELYLKFREFVISACVRVVKKVDIAEDLAQITFMQVFQKIHTFAGTAKLSTWIYRCAVNQSLMYLRRERRNRESTSLTETEKFLAPSYRIKVDEKILIDDCLGKLPKGYRTALVLHDVEGFEHEECAQMMKVAVGTSKSQLHKARMKMRKLIKKKNNPQIIAQVL